MPLRDPKSESHVLAAAAAEQSTVEILNSIHPKPAAIERRQSPVRNSFIEDVDSWVKQYLDLADEVLQSPAEHEPKDKKPAA